MNLDFICGFIIGILSIIGRFIYIPWISFPRYNYGILVVGFFLVCLGRYFTNKAYIFGFVIGVLAIIGHFIRLPFISFPQYNYWMLAIGFIFVSLGWYH